MSNTNQTAGDSTEEILYNRSTNVLSDRCIRLWESWNGPQHDVVPPSSPRDDLNFHIYEPLPERLPDASQLAIPYVREIGVKATIDRLGEHYRCNDHKINLLHFWFLDMIADCLWKLQDEFDLIESDQRIVLEWIVFVFDLIRDPKLNYDRKTLFRILKEAILLICDVISENNCELPLPRDLFAILSKTDCTVNSNNISNDGDGDGEGVDASIKCNVSPPSADSLRSTISNLTCYNASSYLQFSNIDEAKKHGKRYKLGKQHCNSFATSSIDASTRDSAMESSESDFSAYVKQKDDEVCGIAETVDDEDDGASSGDDDIEFYTADDSLPMRFKPIEAYENYVEKEYPRPTYRKDVMDVDEEELRADEIEVAREDEEGEEEENDDLGLYEIDETAYETLVAPQPSEEQQSDKLSDEIEVIKAPVEFKSVSNQLSAIEENVDDAIHDRQSNRMALIEHFAKINRWSNEMKRANDSEDGLTPTASSNNVRGDDKEEEAIIYDENEIDPAEWLDIDDEIKDGNERGEMGKEEMAEEQYAKCQDTKFINFAVLHAIIDFIFEYFYENFHFTLIKLAYQLPLSIAVQNANAKWYVPKVTKGDLTKPKEQKPKKEKKKKEKKPKRSTSKGSKKSKSSKKTRGSKKSGKSSKAKKKKPKKEKKRKLTKEEKAEMERLRKEQELREEELRRIEENRRNLFPLVDAATDDLFAGIFANWVKADAAAKKGTKAGKKKGRGAKK